MYDASLQSLESGIAQSAPQPAAELMQQADVVENRLGEVYEAAGVSKGYSPGMNTSNPQTTSEAPATDVGTLFSDYFDAIGADEMPPFAKFEKMYREGGDAWKELSLKKGWKDALRDGTVGPFTRLEDYKATAGVDGNGGMGYNELKRTNGLGNRAIKGQRTSRYRILTSEEIKNLITDIKEINADLGIFRFNQGYQTGFSDSKGLIFVRGDVLPDLTSTHPRDIMSQRAVLAHEYYGHKYFGNKYGDRNPIVGAWNDEFRASYNAALKAPNLSDMDRMYLMMDALERAKEAGVNIRITDIIRRILYGY